MEEGKDFITILLESTGGRPSQDYILTLSSAKEIAMLNGGEKGKQARLYFIKCEEELKNALVKTAPSYQIEDPIARAEAWIQEQKEKIALAKSNKQLETKVDNLSTAFMYESNWLSILKVSMHNKVSEKVFDWRKLKQASVS